MVYPRIQLFRIWAWQESSLLYSVLKPSSYSSICQRKPSLRGFGIRSVLFPVVRWHGKLILLGISACANETSGSECKKTQANNDYLSFITSGFASSDYFSFIKVNFYSYYLYKCLALWMQKEANVMSVSSHSSQARILAKVTKQEHHLLVVVCLAPKLILSFSYCVKEAMSHKLSGLLSTINGTELSSYFGHFW